MNKIISYLKDSYNELVENVSWPTWGELSQSLMLVLAGTAVFALVIYFMDTIFRLGLEQLYGLF